MIHSAECESSAVFLLNNNNHKTTDTMKSVKNTHQVECFIDGKSQGINTITEQAFQDEREKEQFFGDTFHSIHQSFGRRYCAIVELTMIEAICCGRLTGCESVLGHRIEWIATEIK